MGGMRTLLEDDVIARLAERDVSLFAEQAAGDAVLDRLGWIGLAAVAAATDGVANYRTIADELVGEGATDVVLLGMGGSSLASLVFSEIFGPGPLHPRLTVLDTTSPLTVTSLMRRLDPPSTYFVLSSKSGTTIEPLSLYAIFRRWADDSLGREAAGSHFIAVTDPGTPLLELGRADGMRLTLETPRDVGGRFSALTAFGLLPAALLGVSVERLLVHAAEEERACTTTDDDNPAASLAAWIYDASTVGRDKLTVACSKQYASFALWVEQLLAESTGKRGLGIVPVPESAQTTPSGFGDDRAIVLLAASDDQRLGAWGEALRAEGHPVFEIQLDDPHDIGAQFVRWEYATAMLGYLLGINPFDEPDVGEAKKATIAVLEGGRTTTPTLRVDDVDVTYAGRLAGPAKAPATLSEALAPAFDALRPSDYFGVLAYLPYDEPRIEPLRTASSAVASATGRAVCLELGPRYLHSTGQLHKGGPDEGVFLVVTARDAADVDIPGKPFGLARLHRAQAEGDLATLADRHRRVMRIDLSGQRTRIRSGASRGPDRGRGRRFCDSIGPRPTRHRVHAGFTVRGA